MYSCKYCVRLDLRTASQRSTVVLDRGPGYGSSHGASCSLTTNQYRLPTLEFPKSSPRSSDACLNCLGRAADGASVWFQLAETYQPVDRPGFSRLSRQSVDVECWTRVPPVELPSRRIHSQIPVRSSPCSPHYTIMHMKTLSPKCSSHVSSESNSAADRAKSKWSSRCCLAHSIQRS